MRIKDRGKNLLHFQFENFTCEGNLPEKPVVCVSNYLFTRLWTTKCVGMKHDTEYIRKGKSRIGNE